MHIPAIPPPQPLRRPLDGLPGQGAAGRDPSTAEVFRIPVWLAALLRSAAARPIHW